MPQQETLMDWALQEMAKIVHPNFYGKVTFQFNAGSPVLVAVEETKKPPQGIYAKAPVDAPPVKV